MQTLSDLCDCGGQIIFTPDTNESICGSCGVVTDDPNINYNRDHRAFTLTEHDSRSRTGTPLSPAIHDTGLTTTISRVGRDHYGRKVKTETKAKMLRLRKWHIRSRVHSGKSRNLAQALSILDKLCSKLNLPHHVKEEAATIYRKALESGLVRGRSIEAITAASLYVAIRQKKIPRTIREVTAQTMTELKDVSRCYRLVLTRLNIKTPVPDGRVHISSIAGKLDLSMEIQHKAHDILREAKEKHITSGKDPVGLAAASIYISCRHHGDRTTQKQLAAVAGITEVTIRNRYKGLVEGLNIEF